MEFVEATTTTVQRRTGAVRVLWSDLAGQQQRRGEDVRVLGIGQRVVLCLDGLGFHTGKVLSYLGEGPDGAYVVSIGAPLARREALRRTGRVEVAAVPPQRSAPSPNPAPRVVDAVAIPVQRDRRVELFL